MRGRLGSVLAMGGMAAAAAAFLFDAALGWAMAALVVVAVVAGDRLSN